MQPYTITCCVRSPEHEKYRSMQYVHGSTVAIVYAYIRAENCSTVTGAACRVRACARARVRACVRAFVADCVPVRTTRGRIMMNRSPPSGEWRMALAFVEVTPKSRQRSAAIGLRCVRVAKPSRHGRAAHRCGRVAVVGRRGRAARRAHGFGRLKAGAGAMRVQVHMGRRHRAPAQAPSRSRALCRRRGSWPPSRGSTLGRSRFATPIYGR